MPQGLHGEYKYSVDAKGRLFIPAKLRDEMGNVLVLVRSFDNCINVYSAEKWQSFEEKLNSLPEVKARVVKRYFFSSMQDVEVDAQGRVVLPAQLREYAGINKSVTIIGVGDHAEIWDEAAYNEYMSENRTAEVLSILTECGF